MLKQVIDIHKTSKSLQEIVSQVSSGVEIIFTVGETPVARLVPVGQRIAGLHAGYISVSADFDQPLPDDFWVGNS